MTSLRLIASFLALTIAAPALAQSSVAEPGPLAADFELRLQQIEGQMQQMNGQIEQLQNILATMRQEDKQFRESVDYRLKALEGGAGGAGAAPTGGQAPMPLQPVTSVPNPNGGMPIAQDGQMGFGKIAPDTGPAQIVTPPTSSSGGNAIPPQALTDPQQLYNYAYNLLMQKDYSGAATAFQAFMKNYPQHALAGNAQYWLGETYFVNQDYKTAAVTFAEGFQKFPKGAKAADNLLKLGISLVKLGRKSDACVAFAQLYAKFPDAPPAITQRAQMEMNQLGTCN